MAEKIPPDVGDIGANLLALAGAAAIDRISNGEITHVKREP
jgi:hypothetical protein